MKNVYICFRSCRFGRKWNPRISLIVCLLLGAFLILSQSRHFTSSDAVAMASQSRVIPNRKIDVGHHQSSPSVDKRNRLLEEKIALLQKGLIQLSTRWKKSAFSKIKKQKRPKGRICQRYVNESQQVKVHVLNVWKAKQAFEKSKMLSLVTQIDFKKLPVMERLLEHWTGPVSFALYYDTDCLRSLPVMLQITNSSLLQRDDIVLHLVYNYGEFYPVNFLRNLVLNNTKFEYSFLSDVDFIPSFDSYEYILDILNKGSLKEKQTYVVPAFEFRRKEHVVDYPKSKAQLLKLWHNKTVMPFHYKFFPGHGPTNFKKWAKTNETYFAKFADAYEPYIVIDSKGAPPYPQEFVGRLGNKIAHLLHVHYLGYKFVVLPGAFLIHYPHHVNWNIKHFSCAKQTITAFKAKMKRMYKM